MIGRADIARTLINRGISEDFAWHIAVSVGLEFLETLDEVLLPDEEKAVLLSYLDYLTETMLPQQAGLRNSPPVDLARYTSR